MAEKKREAKIRLEIARDKEFIVSDDSVGEGAISRAG